MQLRKHRNQPGKDCGAGITHWAWRPDWGLIFACLLVVATLKGAAQNPPGFNADKSIHDPVLTSPSYANAQMQIRDQQTRQQSFEAANAERKKQIADNSARLLKLATDLKAEVDKTTKDTLSLNVIRKADEIERLAHNVKGKMTLTERLN